MKIALHEQIYYREEEQAVIFITVYLFGRKTQAIQPVHATAYFTGKWEGVRRWDLLSGSQMEITLVTLMLDIFVLHL